MEILVNVSESKKDLVKAWNTTTMAKDVIGEQFKMTGAIIYKKEELDQSTGECSVKTVCCIKREDGEFISTISPTVENSLQLIVNSYDKEEILQGIDVVIKSKKSSKGRDFIYIDLV